MGSWLVDEVEGAATPRVDTRGFWESDDGGAEFVARGRELTSTADTRRDPIVPSRQRLSGDSGYCDNFPKVVRWA